MHKNNTCYTAM